MSQPSQLKIYFVLPQENKECHCSKDMYEAFDKVKQYKGKPEWVLPSYCLVHKPQKTDVFVFEKFEGKAFEKLKNNSSKILGAKCMLTCMSSGATIPPGTTPIFTEGLRELIVCCTGFDLETKQYLQEKIEYMGGICHTTLRSIITHVVAYNNITPKAIEAYKANKPVMTKEWVDAVWKRSLDANIRGSDKEFDKYRSPLFNNLKITTTGIAKKKKDHLKELISQYGGTFTGTLEMNSTDILLIESPTGDKFKAAKSWKVACVKPSWIHQCVELNRVVPLTDHLLSEKISKVSTPNKEEVTLSANFSMVSAIEHEDRNLTHLEETTDGVCSQTSGMHQQSNRLLVSQLTLTVDKISNLAPEADLFLDGCNIYLSGFNQTQFEKLKKILNIGGATRFDDLTRSVTHIIVSGTPNENLIESGAYVLPLNWLYQSVLLKRPAPVEEYLLNNGKASISAPPSPLSKQTARLLSRPEPRSLNSAFEALPEPDAPPDDDLVQRYNLSQQGEPIAERPYVQNATPLPPSSLASSRSELSQTPSELFKGLKFFLSRDLSEEELENCENLIVRAGGFVASKKFSGVPDFAVVPTIGASLPEITSLEVVTLLFIKDCFIEKQVVPVQYYHLPITWVKDSSPLKDCVFSVSKYVGSERDFIETIIGMLGAIVQDILAKKQKNDILKTTHLVCAEPSGMKFNGALRWGLPVVHHNWLLKCAETGIRVPEESYLLSEKKPMTSINCNETNQSTPASTKKIHKATIESSSGINSSNHPLGSPLQPVVVANLNKENAPLVENSTLKPMSEHRVLTPDKPRKIPLELTKTRTPDINSQTSFTPPVLSRDANIEKAMTPVNRAIERLKHIETPNSSSSPDANHTITPTSPYGACFGKDNPSPNTRKRLHTWMNQGANFPVDPPAKRHDSGRRNSTPLSELISRHLRLMVRRPEDQPPDDSPDASSAKRLNFNNSQTVKNDVISGLQKMKEIEESYSRTNTAVPNPVTVSEEPKVVIVTESQPHTEIGWDDPSDKELAIACLEKAAEKITERQVKNFMLSGLSDILDSAKEIIEKYGGKVSSLAYYDANATHLIGAVNMTRGEKLMGSIAAGLWILHPSYLDQLGIAKDVYALKEEDFEWGNPKNAFPLDQLSKNVKECVISAFHWRCDIQKGQPPPFSGMQFILKIGSSKSVIFQRLFEAGGGKIVNVNNSDNGDNVYCICEMTPPSKQEMESLARRGIRCLTTLFVSDFILRKSTAVQDNLVLGFSEIWQCCQN